MSATRKRPAGGIALGQEPGVDLLPVEVRRQRASAQAVRRAWFAVAGLVVLTVIGVAATGLYTSGAGEKLTTAQDRTQQLLVEQQKYAEVKTADNQTRLIEAAQQVGASTEIDWNDYLARVQATLPDNVVITAVTIDSASPLKAYTQSTGPLQGARVATLGFTATSPTLPSVPTWLDGLAKLPGYVDAAPQSIQLGDDGYTTQMTMHINEKAWDDRFSTSKAKG